MRDDELDAALAALTAADVNPQLADRVLRAIEAEPGRARAFGWPAIAGSVAVAAVVLVSVGVAWRAGQPAAWPAIASAPPFATGAAARARELAADDAVTVRLVPDRRREPVERERPWPYRLPALEPSSPLAIERIERESLHEPRLGVEPLTIAQLEIASLER